MGWDLINVAHKENKHKYIKKKKLASSQVGRIAKSKEPEKEKAKQNFV